MAVHILTIPFDPQHQCFPDDDLRHFLANKRVRSLQPAFFQHDGHPYWTMLIEYEPLLSEAEQRPHEPDLPEERRLLLARLREWRKAQADRDGVPVFLIATNAQLLAVARRGPTSLEALRQIGGFGRKKVERYGAALVGLVGAFLGGEPKSDGGPPAPQAPSDTATPALQPETPANPP